MTRDEALDLILREADAGLDPSEMARLQAALRADPQLVLERQMMRVAWGQIQELGRAARLAPDFGEDRLASIMQPRIEGLLVKWPIRAAAALLVLATLVRGSFAPHSDMQVRRCGNAVATSSAPQPVAQGETIAPQTDEWLEIETSSGLALTLEEGRLTLPSGDDLVVASGPMAATFEFGERSIHVNLGDVSFVGTRAELQVRRDEVGDPIVTVHRGSIRFGGAFGTRLDARSGPVAVASNANGVVLRPARAPLRRHVRRDSEPSVAIPPQRVELPYVATPPALPPADGGDSHTATYNYEPVNPVLVTGRIVAERGSVPVDGAHILLRPRTASDAATRALLPRSPDGRLAMLQDFADQAAQRDGFETLSNADGSFELTGVWPGLYDLSVRAPDDGQVADLAAQTLHVAAADSSDSTDSMTVDLTLAIARRLKGQVLDGDGQPLAGVLVSTATREVKSSADGLFEIRAVADTGAILHLRKPGYGFLSILLAPDRPKMLTLFEAPAIRGVVHDAEGGVVVPQVDAQFERNGEVIVETVAAEVDGSFALLDVPEDAAVRIRVRAGDRLTAARTLAPFEGRGPLQWFDLHRSRSAIVVASVDGSGPRTDAAVTALAPGELLEGVTMSDGVVVEGLPQVDALGLAMSPGTCVTPFTLANEPLVEITLEPARARRLAVNAKGTEIADVLWVVRDHATGRLLHAQDLVQDAENWRLPDPGIDPTLIDATIVIVPVQGSTEIVADDPALDLVEATVNGPKTQ